MINVEISVDEILEWYRTVSGYFGYNTPRINDVLTKYKSKKVNIEILNQAYIEDKQWLENMITELNQYT